MANCSISPAESRGGFYLGDTEVHPLLNFMGLKKTPQNFLKLFTSCAKQMHEVGQYSNTPWSGHQNGMFTVAISGEEDSANSKAAKLVWVAGAAWLLLEWRVGESCHKEEIQHHIIPVAPGRSK